MTGDRIIDAHVHIQPWKQVKPDCLRAMQSKQDDPAAVEEIMYDPRKLLDLMDRDGIEKIVSVNYVSPDIMGFDFSVNEYAADYARKTDGRVIPIGSVHPKLSKDPEGEMKRLIDLGIRGVKLHTAHQVCPANDYRNGNRIQETIFRMAQDAGLVLMIHTGTSIFRGARNAHVQPIHADDIGVDFPELTVILAHGGRPFWMDQALFLLRRFPQFWMDVSSLPPQKLLEYFPPLEKIADRVLWGSDWPSPGVRSMKDNADKFRKIAISDEAKRKILRENALRLYG